MWLQGMATQGRVIIKKVPTSENLADALTKALDGAAISRHVGGVNCEILRDRHPEAPALSEDKMT